MNKTTDYSDIGNGYLNALRERYERSLPKQVVCPHCLETVTREFLGVRLMNASLVRKGSEPRFRPQARCGGCR